MAAGDPILLRVPVLVLSEREDGSLVFLDNDLTLAQANWLLDRMKALLITPNTFERQEGVPAA